MFALPPPSPPPPVSLLRLLQPWLPLAVQEAWPRALPSRLVSCLLLALLLHVWLVLMLGNTPPGTAPPGQGVWGALNVTLRGPAQDGMTEARPPELPPPVGPAGPAPAPRSGGTVRAPTAIPLPEPGAALQGDWAVMPSSLERILAPTALPARLQLPQSLPVPAALAPLAPAPAPAVLAPAPALTATATPAPAPARLPAPAPAPVSGAVEPAVAAAPPAATALVTAPAEPAPVLRRVAPVASVAAAAALAPLQAPATEAPVGLPALAASPTGTALPSATALPAGRPDAGPAVGHDVATAPSAAASAPRLKLDLPWPRGGELSRQGGGGLLPLLPRPPDLPDKLARDIDKAAKADCRNAYQGFGLLAVVPLAADALRGGQGSGCKW